MSMSKTVSVHYEGGLRAHDGTSRQTVQTEAADAAELFEQLRRQQGLRLTCGMVRVAINDVALDWRAPINDGDWVRFIAPVGGG